MKKHIYTCIYDLQGNVVFNTNISRLDVAITFMIYECEIQFLLFQMEKCFGAFKGLSPLSWDHEVYT